MGDKVPVLFMADCVKECGWTGRFKRSDAFDVKTVEAEKQRKWIER